MLKLTNSFKNLFLLSFVVLTVIFAPQSFAQNAAGSINVWPNIVELDFSKNKNKFTSISVYVQNKGSKSERIRAYSQGWNMSEFGIQEYLENPDDRTLNLMFNPKEFDLAPGEKQRVRISTKEPEGPDGEYRGIIFFENVLPKKDILDTKSKDLSVTISFVTRYGVTVYAYKGTVDRNMILEKFEPQIIDNKQYLVTTLKNEGNIHTYVYGEVLLKPVNGGEEIPLKLKKYTLLPESTQKMMIKIPANTMQNGDYKAYLKLSYKTAEEIEESFETEINFNLTKTDMRQNSEILNNPVNEEEIKLTPENVAQPINLNN